MYAAARRALGRRRRKKKQSLQFFQTGFGGVQKQNTFRCKVNLGQVQFAARLLAPIIEQLPWPPSPVHAARSSLRIDHALGERGYKKSPSLEVWVSLAVTRGGGLSIANWKKKRIEKKDKKKRFPSLPAGAHLEGMLLASRRGFHIWLLDLGRR